MTETDLKAFIDVVVNYFKGISGIDTEMGVPFMKNNAPVVLNHTGLIGISGAKKGAVYITADTDTIKKITKIVLDIDDVTENDIDDMIGEIANTIAGNVRMTFGSSFMISVPIILKGKPDDILLKLKPPVFVIPITWNNSKMYLTVGLE